MSDANSSSPAAAGSKGLGTSARASLLWGGGFTLLRDVAQFGVMLILVRLLTPADYGTAALVQAILGVAAAISFQTFSSHVLQIRNPEEIDWQAHFTAAAVLNTVLAILVLALAFGLSFVDRYREAALPLAILSVVLLIEVPGTLRHRMLEANHDWKRFRMLLIVGTILGLGSGLIVALMGGGVWALIVQVPMLGLPAAIDLFVTARFRPDWTWSWTRWRDTAYFGFNRMGAGLVARLRQLVENGVMAAAYDLSTLGLFTRANGLAVLISGRIGSLAIMSLYPVITRADSGSARFQRIADIVLRGVVWTTLPAAAFLGIAAHDTVHLLYGSQWGSVVPLLPLAAAATGIVGVWNALAGLLLANNGLRAALSLDALAALSSMALAFLLVPYGARIYLGGLALHAMVFAAITISVLLRQAALSVSGVAMAIVPAAVAGLLGAAALLGLRVLAGVDVTIAFRILFEGAIYATIYVLTLRILFSRQLTELLEVVPAGSQLARAMMLPGPRPDLATPPRQP